MKEIKSTLPPVLAAQKQKYAKPTFEVIDLNITSPLLAGSGGTSKKAPINPIAPGKTW